MKVSDDPNIGRDALKGFYMFLYAESLRHQEDIDMIKERQEEVVKRIGLSRDEVIALEIEAARYVSF